MKRIFLGLGMFVLFSGMVWGQEVQYRFSQEKPLVYSFKIEGDLSYQYEGIPGEEFKVLSKGNITLETLEVKENSYSIKLIPTRTLIQVNNMVLEDITAQETAISQIVSTALLEIGKNGAILNTKEVNSGILNLSDVLMAIPVFPQGITSGKRWKQTLPAFNLPGVPMCNLEFIYLYTKAVGDTMAKIGLLSNQRINEKRKDKGVDLLFTGLNSSNGEFIFDENTGELRSFKGVVNLDLQTSFKMPPSAGKEVSTKQSLPFKMKIKMNVALSLISGGE